MQSDLPQNAPMSADSGVMHRPNRHLQMLKSHSAQAEAHKPPVAANQSATVSAACSTLLSETSSCSAGTLERQRQPQTERCQGQLDNGSISYTITFIFYPHGHPVASEKINGNGLAKKLFCRIEHVAPAVGGRYRLGTTSARLCQPPAPEIFCRTYRR